MTLQWLCTRVSTLYISWLPARIITLQTMSIIFQVHLIPLRRSLSRYTQTDGCSKLPAQTPYTIHAAQTLKVSERCLSSHPLMASVIKPGLNNQEHYRWPSD